MYRKTAMYDYNANYVDKPINAFRLAVSKAGILTYGKTDGYVRTTLGTLNLVNPSKEIQTYYTDETIILVKGESLWFSEGTDTGKFYYQSGSANYVGAFAAGVTVSNPAGAATTYNNNNLSIDIGYKPGITSEINNVCRVILDKRSVTLTPNDSVQLNATVYPSWASNKDITWSVSNANCTIDNGLLTAVSLGECVVTVTTIDGAHTATCNVTIQDPSTFVDGWYVENAAQITDGLPSAAGSGSFAYSTLSTINACTNKPINTLRFAVHTAGTLSYGKVSEYEYTTLGTLTISNPSTELQTYTIPEIMLYEGERLWFQGATDTGKFYYSNTNLAAANFHGGLRSPSDITTGVMNFKTLGMDIGYFKS